MANWRDNHPEDYSSSKKRRAPARRGATDDKLPPPFFLGARSIRYWAIYACSLVLATIAGFYIGRRDVTNFESSVYRYSRDIESKLHTTEQEVVTLRKNLEASNKSQSDLTRQLENVRKDLSASQASEAALRQKLATAEINLEILRKGQQSETDPMNSPDKQTGTSGKKKVSRGNGPSTPAPQ
jgi:septal ring factor EnvC (AmiA/AmiB activator)